MHSMDEMQVNAKFIRYDAAVLLSVSKGGFNTLINTMKGHSERK